MSNHFRPVYEDPVQNIIIEVSDFSLDKAVPQRAAAIDAQIDRDDTSNDLVEEELHSNIRSSSAASMTGPCYSTNWQGCGSHCVGATRFGVAGPGFGSIAGMIPLAGSGAPGLLQSLFGESPVTAEA
jgi:hypothetical protein